MKIALVLDRFDPRLGGLEQWSYQLAMWLLTAGHDVHVVAFAFTPDFLPTGLIPHELVQPGSRLERAAAAERCLKTLSPDVIHDMGTGWFFDVFHPVFGSRIAGYRRDLASLPPLQRLREWLSPARRRRYRQVRALERRQYATTAGVIIPVSRMVQTHLQTLHGVDPVRMRLVYNGVDAQYFSSEHRLQYREMIRGRLGLQHETLFLFVARNFRLKGLATVLRALHILVADSQPVHLAVVGGGPIETFQRFAARLGVSKHVTFCGFVEETIPYYAAADVFVFPTFYDPCSLVALEAWASGLPVITSRCNGAAELMTPGEEGFVVDNPRDARQVALQMECLLDESIRARMARAARILALEHSSEKKFAALMEIYRQVGAKHLR
jgi:UDP-glucose:(heptosyl)LPS alpha-1,3-glucosyltransferase